MSALGRGSFSKRASGAFALLIAAQAAHSIEEYSAKLYLVMPPAASISRLFSTDPGTGFAIANALFVAFGIWCWIFPIRQNYAAARPLAWGWAILETTNGLGHLGLSVATGGYFPGVATVPLLLFASAWLIFNVWRDRIA